MKYQLVLQFPWHSNSEFEELIDLEDILEGELGVEHNVDGHDSGSGEMNLFILTDKPEAAFDAIVSILEPVKDKLANMKAAYRNIDSDDFIALYPENLTDFSVK